MRLRSVVLGLAAMTSAFIAVSAVRAEDGIYIPLMSYRTGPYSGAGAAIFNGMSDYLAMLNARDGGIGGARLLVEECETGYDTKKGVECAPMWRSHQSDSN
jgi:branched-chain amino acid transport system substrate-binding protein